MADTLPPVLTLLGDNPLVDALGGPFTDPGATATDLCAGDLTASIMVADTVNTNVSGTYAISFLVSDASGNTAQTNRTVLVVPVPLLTGSSVPSPGLFRLQGGGVPGLTYSLLSSTNLVNWVKRTNLWASPSGLIEYLEFTSPDAPVRFYRLRWP